METVKIKDLLALRGFQIPDGQYIEGVLDRVNKKVPTKFGYWLGKNIIIIQKEIEGFEEYKLKVLKEKYIKLDAKGEPERVNRLESFGGEEKEKITEAIGILRDILQISVDTSDNRVLWKEEDGARKFQEEMTEFIKTQDADLKGITIINLANYEEELKDKEYLPSDLGALDFMLKYEEKKE